MNSKEQPPDCEGRWEWPEPSGPMKGPRRRAVWRPCHRRRKCEFCAGALAGEYRPRMRN